MATQLPAKEAILTGRKRHLTPKLLHKFFEEVTEESPDETALIFEGNILKKLSNYRFLFKFQIQMTTILTRLLTMT